MEKVHGVGRWAGGRPQRHAQTDRHLERGVEGACAYCACTATPKHPVHRPCHPSPSSHLAASRMEFTAGGAAGAAAAGAPPASMEGSMSPILEPIFCMHIIAGEHNVGG